MTELNHTEAHAASSDDSADARAALAKLISRYAPHDGLFDLPLPGVHLLRTANTDTNPTRAVTNPGMCIIAQGAKRVLIGQDVYDYDNSRMAVYSTEVPVSAKILRASEAEPYLCLIVDIEPQKLAELTLKLSPTECPGCSIHELCLSVRLIRRLSKPALVCLSCWHNLKMPSFCSH